MPRTMYCSSTMVGRLYGQGYLWECLFDIAADTQLRPIIQIRVRKPEYAELQLPYLAHLLVELFEQPGVIWLAHAIHLQGDPTICYAPVEPLLSSDGMMVTPAPSEMTPYQLAEGQRDRQAQRSYR